MNFNWNINSMTFRAGLQVINSAGRARNNRRQRSTSGTNSSFGTGSTTLNQPTAPNRITTKPTMLTARLVTNPASSRARPKAVTKGHGVGAGTSIVLRSHVLCSSGRIIFHPSRPIT